MEKQCRRPLSLTGQRPRGRRSVPRHRPHRSPFRPPRGSLWPARPPTRRFGVGSHRDPSSWTRPSLPRVLLPWFLPPLLLPEPMAPNPATDAATVRARLRGGERALRTAGLLRAHGVMGNSASTKCVAAPDSPLHPDRVNASHGRGEPAFSLRRPDPGRRSPSPAAPLGIESSRA